MAKYSIYEFGKGFVKVIDIPGSGQIPRDQIECEQTAQPSGLADSVAGRILRGQRRVGGAVARRLPSAAVITSLGSFRARCLRLLDALRGDLCACGIFVSVGSNLPPMHAPLNPIRASAKIACGHWWFYSPCKLFYSPCKLLSSLLFNAFSVST